MAPQTGDQYAVLRAVIEWQQTHNFGPSFRDLVASTSLSIGHVHGIVKELAAEGAIRYTPGVARSIGVA